MASTSTSTPKGTGDVNYITPPTRGAVAIYDGSLPKQLELSPVSMVVLAGREYGRQGTMTRSFSAEGTAEELEQLVIASYGYPKGKFGASFDLEGVAFTVSAMMKIAQSVTANNQASPTYDVKFPSHVPVGHAGVGPRCKQGREQKRKAPDTPSTLGQNDNLSNEENAAIRAVVLSEIGRSGKKDIRGISNYADAKINEMLDAVMAKPGVRADRPREQLRRQMVIYMGDKARAKAKKGESDLSLP